jgi:integrase
VQRFYREKLDSGLAPRTVQYLHTLLRKALKQAVKWGMVPRNVTDAVDAPRPAKKETKYFSFEQAKAFLKVASADRFWTLYVLAISTGLRRGELLGLRWEDLDRRAGGVAGAPLAYSRHQKLQPAEVGEGDAVVWS